MATAGPHAAFFYGTLMAPTVMWRVIHGTTSPDQFQKQQTTQAPALLTGYERRKVKGCDYPAITPCEGGSVRGLLVTGLKDMDLLHLDTFEGDQYTRQDVKVKVLQDLGPDHKAEVAASPGDEMMDAQTYVWCSSVKLESEEWDFEEFRREKIHRWDGIMDWEDDGFDDVDRQVADEAAGDPTGGRATNGAIGKVLETMRSAV